DPASTESMGWEIAHECQCGADAARSIGDYWNLRVALANGAEAYADVNELTLAQVCIDEYESLPPDPGPREHVHYLYSKSDIHARRGEYDKVNILLQEAVSAIGKTGHHDHKTNTLRRLAEVKALTGHFEDAYHYYRAFHEAYVADHGEQSRRRAHALD